MHSLSNLQQRSSYRITRMHEFRQLEWFPSTIALATAFAVIGPVFATAAPAGGILVVAPAAMLVIVPAPGILLIGPAPGMLLTVPAAMLIIAEADVLLGIDLFFIDPCLLGNSIPPYLDSSNHVTRRITEFACLFVL